MSFPSTKIAALAVMMASGVLSAPAAPENDYCEFYTEDYCETRSGSVTYSVHNDGVFQNGGPYFQCGSGEEFSLISYPAGDSNGENPKHCKVFTTDQADRYCNHLDDFGFTTGDGGYYRITLDKTCPSTSSKRDTEALTRNNTLETRDANYLYFYNDPGCQEQSGSVAYSKHNDGCFENGGAYAFAYGDYGDWSLHQYAGTGDNSCSEPTEYCAHGDNFGSCRHVDDTGLRSGQGSYRILPHGCP